MLHFSVPKISTTQRAKHRWRGLALLASKPARPALHRRVALALTAAVDRSAAAELSDELKKPLQALREAGRAKPRWIFAATFFRLQPKPDFRIQCLAARNALPQFSSPQPWFPLCIAAGRSFPSESEAGATLFVRGTQERSALARLAASRKNARTSPNNNAN